PHRLAAQSKIPSDSTGQVPKAQAPNPFDTNPSKPDSASKDSLKHLADSTQAAKGVDTVVTYSASDSITYSLQTRNMTLYNKGEIRYRQMQLQSAQIGINWNTSEMQASGVPDSSSDSTKKRMKGLPIMKDGGEEYHGSTLSYNFKTKRGRINVANT